MSMWPAPAASRHHLHTMTTVKGNAWESCKRQCYPGKGVEYRVGLGQGGDAPLWQEKELEDREDRMGMLSIPGAGWRCCASQEKDKDAENPRGRTGMLCFLRDRTRMMNIPGVGQDRDAQHFGGSEHLRGRMRMLCFMGKDKDAGHPRRRIRMLSIPGAPWVFSSWHMVVQEEVGAGWGGCSNTSCAGLLVQVGMRCECVWGWRGNGRDSPLLTKCELDMSMA